MSTLDDVKTELLTYEQTKPRSLQVESGASQVYGCRAESLFRLTGVSESDPRMSWEAEVGSAVHALLESVAGPGVIPERRVTYKGIPCTVDRFSKKRVTDYKTKNSAGDIAKVQKWGPVERHRGQVHLGAAAMIEAGEEVTHVELLYLPRSGNLDGAFLWSEPFDREVADAAADWLIAEMLRAEAMASEGIPALDEINRADLRDEDEFFCYTYCPFASVCRGERPPEPKLDSIAETAAAKHLAGKALVEEGEAQIAEVRRYLLGLTGDTVHYRVVTSGGNTLVKDVEDIEALRKAWRFLYPDEKLPTTPKETTSSVRLTVKPRKESA